MTRARSACVALACLALAATFLEAGPRARADLRGPRDVDRALDALFEDDDDLRLRAANWLAAHGPDDAVMDALLEAVEDEEVGTVVLAIANAMARRARPSDTEDLLELEHRARARTMRPALVVTLAQLGTEESDAWLVERLSSPAGSELRGAMVEVAEIARQRREALLPRVLDAIAERQPPLLIAWLATLEDERARGALLTIALTSTPSRVAALDGLAHLGPDPDTARRLTDLMHPGESVPISLSPSGPAAPRQPLPLSAELVRALLAADPAADVTAFLPSTSPAIRAAALEALVQHAPTRAIELLGTDVTAMAEADRGVLAASLAHPSAALVPWWIGALSDETLARERGAEALDALVRLPHCALVLDDTLRVDGDVRRLASARLVRACPGRALEPSALVGLPEADALHVRAIAGQDVRDAVAMRWGSAGAREERLALAHAWLASVEADARVSDAALEEDDAEVVAVLVLAMRSHGLATTASRWQERIGSRAHRLAALDAALRWPAAVSPSAARAIDRATVDPDPAVAALALHVVEARSPSAALARLCLALESTSRPIARAARHLLLARPERPSCVAPRARIDAELRRALFEVPSTEPPSAVVLHVVSNVGAALPRVTIETLDGRTARIRPPRDGFVLVPSLGTADVGVRLDAEPEPSGDR